MVGAGLFASRYTPFWFDPDEGCALYGRCVTPRSELLLDLSWWAVAAGFVLVLAGLVAGSQNLPAPPTAPAFALPAPVRAVAAGVIGLVLCPALGMVVLMAAFTAEQLVPAALCVVWLVQARAVLALDRATAPAHRSAGRRWTAGLAATALGLVAVAALANGSVDGRLLPVVDAVLLASAVLIDGVLPTRGEPLDRRRFAAATLSVAAVVAAAGYLILAPPPRVHVPAPAQTAPPVERPRATSPAPSLAPVAPPPVVVDARIACSPDDLVWSTTGWDAAMGTRAVTVVVRHRGPTPCYLDGIADVTVTQGGHELQLVVEPGPVTDLGKPVIAARVGVAPGGGASFALVWKGYGAAADEETPQSLSVVLPGAPSPIDVPLTAGPAPFDLVDGGRLQVGPWQAQPG